MEKKENNFQEQEAPRKNTDNAFVKVGEDGKPQIPEKGEEAKKENVEKGREENGKHA